MSKREMNKSDWEAGKESISVLEIDHNSQKTEAAAQGLKLDAPNAEAYLNAILASKTVGLAVLAPDARFLEMNDAFCEITGYAREELVSLDSAALTHADDLPGMQKNLEALVAGEIPAFVIEKRYLKKNGETVWVQNNVSLVTDAAGKPLKIVAICQDVTARKSAEDAMRAGTERFEIIAQATNDAIWDWNVLTNQIVWNDGVKTLFGYAAEQIHETVDWWSAHIHPEDRERVVSKLQEVLDKGGQEWSDEYRFFKADGSLAEVFDRGFVIRDDGGRAVRMMGGMTDLTERKFVEQQIAGQNEVLEAVALGKPFEEILHLMTQIIERQLPGSLASVLLASEDGARLYCGSAKSLPREYNEAIDGMSIGENAGSCGTAAFRHETVIVADTLTDPLLADFRDLARRHRLLSCWSKPIFSRAGKLYGTFAVYFREPRAPRPAELALLKSAARIAGIVIERREAEETLKFSEKRLKAVFNQQFQFMAILTPDGTVTEINESSLNVTGTQRDEIIGRFFWEIVWFERLPEMQRALEKGVQAISSGRRESISGEADYFYPSGEPRRAAFAISAMRDEDGKTINLFIEARDITEEKRAAERLRKSEAEFRQLASAVPQIVWVANASGTIEYVNEQWIEFSGLGAEETGIHEIVSEIIHPEDREAVFGEWAKALAAGEIYQVEGRMRNYQTGEYRWFLMRSAPTKDQNGAVLRWFGTSTDITAKKLEESRQALLVEVGEMTRQLESVEELLFSVSKAVGECLEVKRCLFNEIDLEADLETVHRDYCRGVESVAGVHQISTYSAVTTAEMKKGKTVVNSDSKTDPRTRENYETAYAPNGERSYVTVPLMRDGRWTASLWVSDDKPRRWSREEIALLETVAERVWSVVEKLRVDQALRGSEEHLAALVNQTITAIAETDLNGQFIYVNDRYCELVGYPREELIGKKSMQEITHEEDIPQNLRCFQKLVATGEPFTIEKRYVRRDGSVVWVSNSVCLLRDAAGRQRSVVAVIVDVTERKHAEAKLRESEEHFRLVVESVPNALLMVGGDGSIVLVNSQAERLFGYSREELTGMSVERLVPERFRASHATYRGEFFGNPQVRKMGAGRDLYCLRKDGSELPVEIGLNPMTTAGGKFVLISIIDITERKESAEKLLKAERRARRDYQTLLARIAPLAQTLGTARDLTTVYRALLDFIRLETPCEEFFVSFFEEENQLKRVKYVWSEGVELDAGALVPIPLFNTEEANGRAIRTGKSVVTTRALSKTEVTGRADRPPPTHSMVTPMIVMGRVIGTLEVQNQRGKYRRGHIVALEMAANLAAVAIENVRLMNVETEARAAAEEANRAKDEFLAVLSHELRTPLHSIKGWVSMLQNQSLDERQRAQAVEVIARNVNSQNALIEDILDVSRIISGKMRLETERLSLVSVLQNVIDAMRPIAERKGLVLEFDLDLEADSIEGDAFRLQQIIGNLLNNAIKFSSSGGTISVRLAREGDLARLSVTDTGIGIAPDILPRVFDRFQQADGTSKRKYSGLGLGLAIVRHLSELHGGRVFAASAGEGKGATFTVELPLIVQEFFPFEDGLLSRGANRNADDARLLANLNLLVVDDEPDTLEMMRVALENYGANVVCANSAGQALEKISREKFDLLISDVGMAEMDGYDLIRHIRQTLNLSAETFPAIALSGYVSPDDRDRAFIAGFQRHLGKPVDVEDLPYKIKALMTKN